MDQIPTTTTADVCLLQTGREVRLAGEGQHQPPLVDVAMAARHAGGSQPIPMSNETHHALKVIRDYLEGENEAVQYELEFMADQVTQSSSGMIGGFQAGNVPTNDVVTDNGPEVFELNASPSGSPTGSVSLNLNDGEADGQLDIHRYDSQRVRRGAVRREPVGPPQRSILVRHRGARHRLLRPDHHEHLRVHRRARRERSGHRLAYRPQAAGARRRWTRLCAGCGTRCRVPRLDRA